MLGSVIKPIGETVSALTGLSVAASTVIGVAGTALAGLGGLWLLTRDPMEAARKKSEETRAEVDSLASEIENLNSKISSNIQRIDELSSKTGRTFTESAELANLREENELLEQQVRVREQNQSALADTSVRAELMSIETLNRSNSRSASMLREDDINPRTGDDASNDNILIDQIDQIHLYIAALREMKTERLRTGNDKLYARVLPDRENELFDMIQLYSEYYDRLMQYEAEGINITPDGDEFLEEYKSWFALLDNMDLTVELGAKLSPEFDLTGLENFSNEELNYLLGLDGLENISYVSTLNFKLKDYWKDRLQDDFDISSIDASKLIDQLGREKIPILYTIENAGEMSVDELIDTVNNLEQIQAFELDMQLNDDLVNTIDTALSYLTDYSGDALSVDQIKNLGEGDAFGRQAEGYAMLARAAESYGISVEQLVDSLSSMDLVMDQAAANAAKFEHISSSFKAENDALSGIFSNSSTGELTLDSYNALMAASADYAGCIEMENGVMTLNREKAQQLNETKNKLRQAEVELLAAQARSKYEENAAEIEKLTGSADDLTDAKRNSIKALEQEQEALQQTIGQYAAMASELNAANSSYTKWKNAQSMGNTGDTYREVTGAVDQIEYGLQSGRVFTVEYQAAVELLVPESERDNIDDYLDNVLKQYFTDDNTGTQNFIDKLGELVEIDEDRNMEIAGTMAEVAERLNLNQEALEMLLGDIAEQYTIQFAEFMPEDRLEGYLQQLTALDDPLLSRNGKYLDFSGTQQDIIDALGITPETAEEIFRALENYEFKFERPEFWSDSNFQEQIEKMAEEGLGALSDEGFSLDTSWDNLLDFFDGSYEKLSQFIAMAEEQYGKIDLPELTTEFGVEISGMEPAELTTEIERAQAILAEFQNGTDLETIQLEFETEFENEDAVRDYLSRLAAEAESQNLEISVEIEPNLGDTQSQLMDISGDLSSIAREVDTVAAMQIGDLGASRTLLRLDRVISRLQEINEIVLEDKSFNVTVKETGSVSTGTSTGIRGKGGGNGANMERLAAGTTGAAGGPTLVGELGMELVISGDEYYTVGALGPELVSLKKGDIVFNADDTKRILKGLVTSRGAALAGGNAAYGGQVPAFFSLSAVGSSGSDDPEELIKYYQHLRSMQMITDREYYDYLMALNEKYYRDNEEKQDEYRKNIEELYTLGKALAKDLFTDQEHQIFLLSKGDGTEREQIELYRGMMDELHRLAEEARARGMSDDSDYIQELQKQWWSYHDSMSRLYDDLADQQRAIYDNQKAITDAALTLLQYQMRMATNTGDTTRMFANYDEQWKYYGDIQKRAHEEAERLRAEGYAEDSDEIQALIKTWWDAYDQIIDINRQLANYHLGLYDDFIKNADNYNLWGQMDYSRLDVLQGKLKEINRLYEEGLLTAAQYNELTGQVQLEIYKEQQSELGKAIDLAKQEAKEHTASLKNQISQYKEIIDLKKKSLQQTKQENSYQKTVEEKVRAIAELQAKINLLSLDDSRSAQAEKRRLEEELADLQGDLADYQADYAVDRQLEAYDEQYAAYEETVNEEISTVEKAVDEMEQLYSDLVSGVITDWGELYDALDKWQGEYMDSIAGNDSLVTAWDDAIDKVRAYTAYLNEANLAAQVPDAMRASGIVGSMKANSDRWHSADETTRRSLERQNEDYAAQLAEMLGLNIVKENGEWFILYEDENGAYRVPLYKYFHTGGVVGGGDDLRHNEVLSVLEKGEVVLTRAQWGALSEGLLNGAGHLADMLLGRSGAALAAQSSPAGHPVEQSQTFAPVISVSIPHSGGLDTASAERFGQTVGETVLDALRDTFNKMGTSRAVLKA